MNEPDWKKLRLSLERPYKDDQGERIPVLLDITPEGQHIYEPKEDPAKQLGENLRRLIIERGVDFFEKLGDCKLNDDSIGGVLSDLEDDASSDASHTLEDSHEQSDKPMTVEELQKMRMEIMPQLFIASGEMSHARDLLNLLISSQGNQAAGTSNPSSVLSAAIVSKPPKVASVQAFDSQLAIGSKDEALRKAADLFKSSAESMERVRMVGEKYWVNALKIRRCNWGLVPAPLPYGSSTAKGADKTSKDFLISFGLEESPPAFRRKAIGHLTTDETESDPIVFPNRQRTRLRILVSNIDSAGVKTTSQNVINTGDVSSIESALALAQEEVIEQEIFSMLVTESSRLPTALARVSERLIVIEVAAGVELRFELIDSDALEFDAGRDSEICNFIHSVLRVLLLRMHSQLKSTRLGRAGLPRHTTVISSQRPLVLQPIIDLLQYRNFCERIEAELGKMAKAVDATGISSVLRFTAVGENGLELVKLLDDESTFKIGGEAVLRIDNRYTLRLSFVSPSFLTAHLPQATLAVSSIPQLCQLLSDEVEYCLLTKICDLGSELCSHVSGTWFVDLVTSRSVGRWEGCVINLHVFFVQNFVVQCSAFRMDRDNRSGGNLLETYTSQSGVALMSWVEQIIRKALTGRDSQAS